MGLRLLIFLFGLVSLAPPLWADSCDLRNGLISALNAQTEMIRALRSGTPISSEGITALRQERAELSGLDIPDAAHAEAVSFILADMAALDPFLASGSLALLEQHLSGIERRDRLAQLQPVFADMSCQSVMAAEADVGDLGLPLLPNGRLGTAAMTASTILVFSGLWAVYGVRARAEALRRRYLVALRTTLTVEQERLSVQVNNISRTGAQIRMTERPHRLTGQKVDLMLEGTATSAKIVWQTGAIVGVAFDRNLDEPLFQALTRAKTPQRPGRIGRHPGAARP